MEEFFQSGIGFGSSSLNHMNSIMGGYEMQLNGRQNNEPQYFGDSAKIPDEFMQEARFQPGYDEEDDPIRVRKIIKQKKNQAKYSYDQFEEKLSEGILDAPNLKLHQVPPSIFDNDPPIRIIYLKDNPICELPEFFFDELPHLAWFDIRDCKLTNLPALGTRHESLRVLLLQGNKIRALPYTLALAINLRTIGLTGNPLSIPPENVQRQGCKKMLQFLHENMMKTVPMDEAEEFESLKVHEEDDAKLRDDLRETALKCVKRKESSSSTLRGQASVSTLNSETDEKRRAQRLIYTWELWKRVPYDGVSNTELFEKSLEEAKSQVLSRLNTQQEALLQKCKNREVLKQWRSETKLMQMNSKPDLTLNPTASAPFGNELNKITPTNSKFLRPHEYKQELEECWGKLKEFSANPAPLSDTNLALKRLKEVEDIHKRLINAKLVIKPQIL